MNKNGKIDGEDLAKLRAKKEELEVIIAELEAKNENAEQRFFKRINGRKSKTKISFIQEGQD